MSNFTVEQKSQLAKLMATENVTIQHQKISTARFDLKNRTIYLPIWSEMSGPLYDLLFGHEVGHALETPYEGLHDVMTNLPEGKGRGYKSFLNIVEDARIEKRIQRRYPGLRLSFKKGYADLMARDFFGTKGRDINTFPFIDRLNLFTKSQYTLDVQFTDREQEMVEKVKKLESWDDTVRVTDEIYEYAKNEEPETNFGDSFADGDDSYEDGFGEEGGNLGDDTDFEDTETDGSGDDAEGGEDSNSDSDEDENGQDSDSKADGGDASDDDEEKSEAGAKGEKSDESSDETDEDGELGEYNRYKESGEADSNSDGPRSITDENFRANEGLLVDATSFDYDYVSLPTPNLDAIVTPAKRVQEQMTSFYKIRSSENYGLTEEDIKNALTEFKRKNDRYISLLAKEFEMKKAAKSYSKRKVSDTGDIDINKLASYRVNDNIFKRMTKIPKGKSHGLVLLLDYSGSMQENMAGSIEQILVLTAFCRKVNIPFVVYSFGNSTAAVRADFGGDSEKVNRHCFSRNVGEFSFGQVRLREYLNSNMSTAEYNNAIKNMICLGKSYENGNRYYNRFGRPESECLSNTPTIEALVALQPIVKKFREQYNLDITNLVVVQDGDADYVNQKLDLGYANNVYAVNILSDKKRANVILQDTKNKFTKQLFRANQRVDYRDYTRTLFSAVVEWFTLTTNSKAFGFYMVPGGPSRIRNAVIEQYRDKNGTYLTDKYNGTNRWEMIRNEAHEIAKAVKRDRFLDANKEGYSGFYLIPGGKDLMTEDDELVVEGKVTAGKLKTAFMKMNEKKQTNRVLVSRFIDGIAA